MMIVMLTAMAVARANSSTAATVDMLSLRIASSHGKALSVYIERQGDLSGVCETDLTCCYLR